MDCVSLLKRGIQSVTICNEAIDADASLLAFIDGEFHTFDMYLKSCKKYGSMLKYVNCDKLDQDQYNELCTLAVSNNGYALQFVNGKLLVKSQYEIIYKIAIKKHSNAGQYVDQSIISLDEYTYKYCMDIKEMNGIVNGLHIFHSITPIGLNVDFDGDENVDFYSDKSIMLNTNCYILCREEIVNNKHIHLSEIKNTNFTNDEYYDLCQIILSRSNDKEGILEYLNPTNLTREQYNNICFDHINKHIDSKLFGLVIIPIKILTYELYKFLIEKSGFDENRYIGVYAVKFWDVTDEQFDEIHKKSLCSKKINHKALKYIKNLDEEYYKICENIIKDSPDAMKYMKVNDNVDSINSYIRLCEIAVSKKCELLEFVREEYQTYEMCYSAIKQNSRAIVLVKNDILVNEHIMKVISHSVDEFVNEDVCAICLDDSTEKLCQLSCCHVFHNDCIVSSIKKMDFNITCPLCRNKFNCVS